MRVLIADDHPFTRKGVRTILAEELGIEDVVEAENGMEAYDRLISESFDLAIIDLIMPGGNGLQLIKDVLALRPRMPFLVLSILPEREFAERAYKCGAKGYLGKIRPISDFIEAVRYILSGKTYVNPEFAQSLVERIQGPRPLEKTGINRLSDRELAVLSLFGSGESLTEIGTELHISIKTVSTHKTRIMEKLHLRSNADLMVWALAQGLVPARPQPALEKS
jgi:two-component system, NarL family, invasion response regulator UvrY